MLVLISFVGSIVSGVIVSRHLFAFLNIKLTYAAEQNPYAFCILGIYIYVAPPRTSFQYDFANDKKEKATLTKSEDCFQNNIHTHFCIRDVVLEAIVKEAISELADFVRCYNSAFLYLISEKKGAESINREKSLRAKTESAKQRISDLDKLFSRIYEDNILGKLSDERYSRMANEYEAEQKRLISEVEENEKVLIELQKQTVDMKMLYQGLMEFTEMKHLTPTVVNKLIERIEIHNNEKKHSHNNVKVDIYFTAAGLFDIPTEQQLIDTMERVKQKKAEKSA